MPNLEMIHVGFKICMMVSPAAQWLILTVSLKHGIVALKWPVRSLLFSKGREPIKNIILRVKGYVEQHFVSLMQLKGKCYRH